MSVIALLQHNRGLAKYTEAPENQHEQESSRTPPFRNLLRVEVVPAPGMGTV